MEISFRKRSLPVFIVVDGCTGNKYPTRKKPIVQGPHRHWRPLRGCCLPSSLATSIRNTAVDLDVRTAYVELVEL